MVHMAGPRSHVPRKITCAKTYMSCVCLTGCSPQHHPDVLTQALRCTATSSPTQASASCWFTLMSGLQARLLSLEARRCVARGRPRMDSSPSGQSGME